MHPLKSVMNPDSYAQKFLSFSLAATPSGILQWYCLELPSLKKLNEFPEPVGWNWNVAALGTRYACSFYAGQLRTLDLTTGHTTALAFLPV